MSAAPLSEPPLPAPVTDIDLFSDESLADLPSAWAAIRDLGPVVWMSRYGVYAMGRHAHVRPVLTDWKTFSSTGGSGLADIRRPDAWRAGSPIVEVDPPDHTAVRRALQKILSPVLIRGWKADFEAAAEALVDRLLEQGSFDGVSDLAEEYVSSTFPPALGLVDEPQRRANLFLLGEYNFDGQGPRNARFLATEAKVEEIRDWFNASMTREAMVPGGFGAQIFEAADRGEIVPEVAPLLVRSFLRGGLDTTSSTISAALRHLSEDPAQFALLREDPDARVKSAFDEAMRLEAPIPNVGRLTMAETEIGGVPVAADHKMLVLLGAANRDPEAWEDAARFDLRRNTNAQMALGTGIHMCIGQMIARLEGEAVLKAVAGRVGRITPEGAPVRKLNNNLRSLKSLPLRFHPA
ncbi:cytochrome P450 [Paroceanicella profunda]|uniref:Cytochrome P450 n=1 Tax=Paroceanicella profunda TaxID=2579971 RepID=A0A5B8FG82_9RHOB|nr:cytochrome P450 [Paroceanicella profunda]QDL90528.1 cytochrome P450 [Paroceanicella profunda]